MPVLAITSILGTPTQVVASTLQPAGTINPGWIAVPAGATRVEYAPQMSDADASNTANSIRVYLRITKDGGTSFWTAAYLWKGGDGTDKNGAPSRPFIAFPLSPSVTHVQLQADIHAPITVGFPLTFK